VRESFDSSRLEREHHHSAFISVSPAQTTCFGPSIDTLHRTTGTENPFSGITSSDRAFCFHCSLKRFRQPQHNKATLKTPTSPSLSPCVFALCHCPTSPLQLHPHLQLSPISLSSSTPSSSIDRLTASRHRPLIPSPSKLLSSRIAYSSF
jgi:hypothetical protein